MGQLRLSKQAPQMAPCRKHAELLVLLFLDLYLLLEEYPLEMEDSQPQHRAQVGLPYSLKLSLQKLEKFYYQLPLYAKSFLESLYLEPCLPDIQSSSRHRFPLSFQPKQNDPLQLLS